MPDTKASQSVATRMRRPLLTGALALAGAATVVAPGAALADTFLRLGDIQGESVADGHKGEIDILSFTQSFISSVAPAGSGGGVGKVQCGGITLMKNIDSSSPMLLKNVALGTHIRDGTITFQTTGKAAQEYYTITMKEVFVTELTQTDAADPNRIFEKLVLNAASYEFEYRPVDAKGAVGASIKFGYNCETARGI